MKLPTGFGVIAVGFYCVQLFGYNVEASCQYRNSLYPCGDKMVMRGGSENGHAKCCPPEIKTFGPGCGYGGPDNPPTKCFGDEREMFMEMFPGKNTSLCCAPGDDGIPYWESSRHIRTTKCIPESSADRDNLCKTGTPPMYIDDKHIEFTEVTRDQCNDADGHSGIPGVQAVCTVPGTQEEYLTTLSGAEPSEFPHFARVGQNGCGGSIYNDRWIITASHCVVNHEGTRKVWDAEVDGHGNFVANVAQVRLNLQIKSATSKHTYNVLEVHVHPNSSFTKPTNDPEADTNQVQINDLALLKLDRRIEFDDNVKPIKLAKPGFDPLKYGDHGLLTGFGDTDTLWQPEMRFKANLQIHPKDKALVLYKYRHQLLYAGGIQDGTTSPNVGKGDSGGPLLCREKDGMPVLCGVVGFLPYGTAACMADLDKCLSSTFVDVQYFNKWIRSVIGEEQDSRSLLKTPLYGSAVGNNEFPAHVHVTASDGTKCGGTLIEEDVVLTAAHCVANGKPSALKTVQVTTGLADLNGGDGGRTLKVQGILVHDQFEKVNRPLWGSGGRKKRVASIPRASWQGRRLPNSEIMKEPYYKNDVALLKLSDKTGITPAKLATSSPVTENMATEVAYPLKSAGTASKDIPLSKREFKMLSRADCQKRMDRLMGLKYDITIDENVVCGVEHFSGGSLCDRESGGGLYCKLSYGRSALCGVQVSRLCQFNIPNEFIDVASMRYWLDPAVEAVKNWKGK